MHEVYGYWDYGGPLTFVGALDPNGGLVFQAAATGLSGYPYWNLVYLVDVPANCSVSAPNPTDRFKVSSGSTLDIEFPVVCSR
jgi:hypothetical protein